jgi:LAO/AO transport system kinase
MKTAENIKKGDLQTVTRFIRSIEDNEPGVFDIMKKIYPCTGNAHVIGFTGSPGAGKSTLIDAVIAAFRAQRRSVGALLVDPTSPFSGGSFLGDRIRMQRHVEDSGVFVRSLATKGVVGGLSKAVGSAIRVLDAMGKDVIIVETVGAGQQELDIMNYAHTTVVVLVPGMGDDIQVIKAGILEIANIFLINKAHSDGAEKLEGDLQAMLSMANFREDECPPPVIKTGKFGSDDFQTGIESLVAQIDNHRRYLLENKSVSGSVERRQLEYELRETIRTTVFDPILRKLTENGLFDDFVMRIEKGELDPYTCAEDIARQFLGKGFNVQENRSSKT